MFWGLKMEPQWRYTQKVKKSFRISKACLDSISSSDDLTQVMCTYEGRDYLLCSLRKPDILQCSLELEFEVGTEVSFAINGKAHVHLTGYMTESIDEDRDEGEESKVNKNKRQNSTDERKAAKKAKLLNGSAKVKHENKTLKAFVRSNGGHVTPIVTSTPIKSPYNVSRQSDNNISFLSSIRPSPGNLPGSAQRIMKRYAQLGASISPANVSIKDPSPNQRVPGNTYPAHGYPKVHRNPVMRSQGSGAMPYLIYVLV